MRRLRALPIPARLLCVLAAMAVAVAAIGATAIAIAEATYSGPPCQGAPCNAPPLTIFLYAYLIEAALLVAGVGVLMWWGAAALLRRLRRVK